MTGLPDDPSDRPTQLAAYGFDGPQQGLEQGSAGSAEHADSAAPDGAPEPWYRSRMLLALWGLLVALLLALVIYGIVELSRGGSETGGPAATTSSTSSTATTPSSTATPTTTPSTSIAEAPPPPESPDTPQQTPEEAPEEQPPPANGAPAPAEPPEHHHHLPHIPSTITLPHTVITLPHGR